MNNKVALVTGGTSGIGRATVIALAEKGVNVVVSGRREELGQKIIEDIIAKGGKGEFVKLDVTDEDNVKKAIERIIEKYGRLDLAVNNAGIAQIPEALVNTNSNDFQKLLQTNVMGVFYSMKYELQHMIKSGSGAIVNISSICGIKSTAGSGAYNATKFAVEALTKSTALEVAEHKIRINSVAPGPTHSEITGAMPDKHDLFANMIPLKRMGNAEDIANGILWLLSDETSFVTGSTLVMDGGLTA